jgi:hypothetical protein
LQGALLTFADGRRLIVVERTYREGLIALIDPTEERPVTGPAVGECDDQSENSFDLGHERVMYSRASFAVPPRRISILVGSIEVKDEPNCAHEPAGRSVV